MGGGIARRAARIGWTVVQTGACPGARPITGSAPSLPASPPPMHILIADDDPGTRLIVAAAVERLGHECTVAEDGAEAWRRFAEAAPDVVITDWDMPGMDGTELTRRIRSQVAVPYPYVIILTARADQDRRAARHGGRRGRPRLQAARPRGARAHARRRRAGHRAPPPPAPRRAPGRADRPRQPPPPRRGPRGDAARARSATATAGASRSLDIDHFKGYNDGTGHLAGDDLLRRMSVGARRHRPRRRHRLPLRRRGVPRPAARADARDGRARRRAAARGSSRTSPCRTPTGASSPSASASPGRPRAARAPTTSSRTADAALYAAKAAGATASSSPGPKASGAPIRIMVADDDEVVKLLSRRSPSTSRSLELVGTAADAARGRRGRRDAPPAGRPARPRHAARRRHAGRDRHPSASCRRRGSSR